MLWISIFVIVFLVLSALLAFIVYGLGVAIKKQANREKKRFFAPVPRPGSFSFVTLEGVVKGVIESVVGWSLVEQEKVGGAKCFVLSRNKMSQQEGILRKYLGVVWIGLFETIMVFPKWKWSEFRQVTEIENGKKVPRYLIEAREEPVSEFFFQFPYPVTLEDAEIAGNIRVKIVAVMTVWHLHPVRAFFLNKDPVALFNAMVQSVIRTYVADKDFDEVKEIIASRDSANSKDGDSFWEVLDKLNGIKLHEDGNPDYDGEIDPSGLFGKLGFYITRGEVIQVEAVGEAAEALEANRLAALLGEAKIMEALKAGEARVIAATKEAEALEIRKAALANFVNATVVGPIREGGKLVANVLEAQVLAGPDSKLTVLVQRGASTGTTIPIVKQ